VARERLAQHGIRTIGQLADAAPAEVERLLGDAVGGRLSALAHNEDPRRVATSGRARSIGAQSAMGRRTPTPALVREVLAHLAERVGGRMRGKGRAARTVTVRVRFPGMRSVTRSLTLPAPIAATLTITEIAEQLAWQAIDEQQPRATEITLLAISVSNLRDQPVLQLELPVLADEAGRSGSPTGAARWAVDHSMDEVRRRFGRTAVGYASVALSEHSSVPDEFRELAEHEL
jgi:DNA polymerase-4